MDIYVRRAEHALRTGQPNLAMLYMRRGLSETLEGQTWLIWHDFRMGVAYAARTFQDAARDAARGTCDDYELL